MAVVRVTPEEKPLNVRVAEAVGWECWQIATGDWDCRDDDDYVTCVPEFDMDWAATGPLIERFKIELTPPVPDAIALVPMHWQWIARARQREDEVFEFGQNAMAPLVAVCLLILQMSEAGKL